MIGLPPRVDDILSVDRDDRGGKRHQKRFEYSADTEELVPSPLVVHDDKKMSTLKG